MTEVERVHAWLQQFAECVRRRDIESGKALFSSDASGFGTRTLHARDREELVEHQWTPTWNNTRDFCFVPETVSFLFSDDASLAMAMARWTSLGVRPNGETFPRQGRCTIVLQRCDSNAHGYIAKHTHFSKDPAGDL